MGGSNVEVNIGPITFQDGAVISTAKNNVCRSNYNFPSQFRNILLTQIYITVFFSQLQAHGDRLDSMELMHPNLRGRDEDANQICGGGQWDQLHRGGGHLRRGLQHGLLDGDYSCRHHNDNSSNDNTHNR